MGQKLYNSIPMNIRNSNTMEKFIVLLAKSTITHHLDNAYLQVLDKIEYGPF